MAYLKQRVQSIEDNINIYKININGWVAMLIKTKQNRLFFLKYISIQRTRFKKNITWRSVTQNNNIYLQNTKLKKHFNKES